WISATVTRRSYSSKASPVIGAGYNGGVADGSPLEVYRRLVDDVWNRGDEDAITAIFHPDFVGHDPAPPRLIDGPAGMRRFVAEMRAAFPDWTVHTDDIVTNGDRLVS